MKSLTILVLAIGGSLALSPGASAQTGGASAAAAMILMKGGQRRQVADFAAFLEQHPAIDTVLRSGDASAIASDQAFQSYLQTHQPLAKALMRHPKAIMKQVTAREKRDAKRAARATRP